jgi:hypothetical protein
MILELKLFAFNKNKVKWREFEWRISVQLEHSWLVSQRDALLTIAAEFDG